MAIIGAGLALSTPAMASAASKPTVGQGVPRVPLDPIAADRFFAKQRAGYGSPRQAAQRYLDARAHASAMRRTSASSRPSLSNPPWSPLGPSPITGSYYGGNNSGRVTSVAVVPSGPNANELVVGTAGGGVWTSTNGGSSWATNTDQAASGIAIGAVAVDPTNPSVIYAGTGEDNSCGDCFYGMGVLKSTNDGASWTVENPSGVFTGVDFSSIVVDPNTGDILAGTSAGLYESTDGGASWTLMSSATNVTAVVIDSSTNPSTVYAAEQSIGVEKGTTSGGYSLLPGLPTGTSFGYTALAIGSKTPSGGSATSDLYASVYEGANVGNGGDTAVFYSSNAGASWTQLTAAPAFTNQSYAYGSGTSDQGSYDNTLAVDPTNPQHLLAGGIGLTETTDGGTTWSNPNGQSFFGAGTNLLHPDFHALTFLANGSVLIGCDGGVFEYNPTTKAVSNLNSNLNITQFYEGLGHVGNGSMILGGAQDNGTALYSGSPAWTAAGSGDGGYSAINRADSSVQLQEADSALYYTSDTWAQANDITPPYTTTSVPFTPPMTVVPTSSGTNPIVYYGAGNLWATSNPSAASPTWTRLTSVAASGGVSAISVAPSNPSVIYVGWENGTIEMSTNGGASFTDLTPTNLSPSADWITHIAVDPTNPYSVDATVSYSNVQFIPGSPDVLANSNTLSSTAGASWTNITGDLPSGVATNSVVYDQGNLFVATDVGVFATPAATSGSSTSWAPIGTGLPNVQVVGLSTTTNGTILAATHGRGIWELAPATTQAPPSVVTQAATSVTATQATLNGTVNPNGAATTYQFQYGTTTSYGSVSPASPASAGS
ncbi:MAG: hypothetical protein ACYDBS_11860, partial [Acidimicrobiales bacterium]